MTKDKIERVKSRLRLVNKLTELKTNFKGDDLIEYPTDDSWTHPYIHFSTLRFYLVLTCFDILGSTKDFIPFTSWLDSEGTLNERRPILESVKDLPPIEQIKSIHSSYNKLYGPTQGFKRFINEVISHENKVKLLKSIRIRKISKLQNIELEYLPSDSQKIEFLSKVRNSFTHEGKDFACPRGGLFEDADDGIMVDGVKMWGLQIIHVDHKGKHYYEYGVRRWPSTLINIIEDTIN